MEGQCLNMAKRHAETQVTTGRPMLSIGARYRKDGGTLR